MADRKRKLNWSADECNLLVDECVENISTITGKFSTHLSATDKIDFWEKTSEIINASGMSERSVPEVMKKWAETKSKAKQAEHKRRAAQRKTGGGPPPPTLSGLDEKIVSIIPRELLEGVAFGEDTFVTESAGEEKSNETEVVLTIPELDEENIPGETCKKYGPKKAKISESNNDCKELVQIENEILQESKNRNILLQDIAVKMDTMMQLKRRKLELLERQLDITNEARLTSMLFES